MTQTLKTARILQALPPVLDVYQGSTDPLPPFQRLHQASSHEQFLQIDRPTKSTNERMHDELLLCSIHLVFGNSTPDAFNMTNKWSVNIPLGNMIRSTHTKSNSSFGNGKPSRKFAWTQLTRVAKCDDPTCCRSGCSGTKSSPTK